MSEEYNRGRDHFSSIKIDYFHYFLTQLVGYKIHPSVRTSSRPCRVADLGTQTAIWPISVAEDPTLAADIDAFDCSDKCFPPSAWLPGNLRLHLHDVYRPFSDQFHGQFDIVHLRLFLNLSATQVSGILRNAIQLLKPGGYVQWTEHDKANITPTAASPGLSMEAAQRFIELQQSPFPNYDVHWVDNIKPLMTENGLEVVALDRIKTRLSMLPQINELHLLSMMDVPKGLSAAVDDFRDKHLDALVEEYRKGTSTIDGFICVVGKKPHLS